MKIIEIQNCTDYRDSLFKVIINGEKYVVDKLSKKIQIGDDKPFEIKVKYIWGTSPKYILEPKDNMILQIYVNQRIINISFGLVTIAMALVMVTGWFFDKGLLKYIADTLWVIMLIHHIIITRKKSFFIQVRQQKK